MAKKVTIGLAKQIMGNDFIGSDDLRTVAELNFRIPDDIPEIPYTKDEIEQRKDDYLLILGLSKHEDGSDVTIRNMRLKLGMDPDISEPCFYNQDWYEKESFIDNVMPEKWFFIRKNVYEDSRAVLPTELKERYAFPDAITCTYSFFVSWYVLGIKLWYHDFVWCSDTDHNGDRIYVGKYHDIDGVNKNGFSIHRHLALRPCYGCID